MCREESASQKKKSYSDELYAACKYIIEHLDEFKEFKIYEDLSNEDSSPPTNERAKNLSNRLWAQYNLLVGEGVPVRSKEAVKGADIMPSFNIKDLKPEDLAWILAFFHHYINKDEERHKLKESLIKVNIEKPTELLDGLIFYIIQKNTDDFKSEQKDFLHELNEKYELARREHISKMKPKPTYDALDCYWDRINYIQNNINKIEIFSEPYKEFRIFEPVCRAWLYIDLCCYAIMQFVIHGIMRNKENQDKLRSIREINHVILELIERAKKEKSEITLEVSLKEKMFQFYAYYYRKDRFLQDIRVLKHIINSNIERKNPLPEYSLINYTPKNEKIDWEEMKSFFSEGEEKETVKTFKKNVISCYKGILKFDLVSGRRILPDPISLRAFYREIYRDETRYNGRQSKSIFNEFLKTKNIGHIDYFFIDEKINTGIFREYGLMEEFYEKNELQENLYCLACYSLARLNPSDMRKLFDKAVGNISVTIERIGSNDNRGKNALEIERGKLNEMKESEELHRKFISEYIRRIKNGNISCLDKIRNVDDMKDEDIVEMINKNIEGINDEYIEAMMMLFFDFYKMKFSDGKI